MPLCALEGFSKNQHQYLVWRRFGSQMTYHNTKKGAAMRKIVSSNLQLPQRVWASAQQSLSKLAFAFALHHSCTLPEPALVPPRSLQVYPREATKRLHHTRFKTTPMFCHSYTDVLMKQRRCFKEAAAKGWIAGGNLKRGCRGNY